MKIPIEILAVVFAAILSFLGSLFVLLINAFKKNTSAYNEIGAAIKNIEIWMTKKDTAETFENKECAANHKYINEKFSKHSDIIQSHEIRLTILEK